MATIKSLSCPKRFLGTSLLFGTQERKLFEQQLLSFGAMLCMLGIDGRSYGIQEGPGVTVSFTIRSNDLLCGYMRPKLKLIAIKCALIRVQVVCVCMCVHQ